MTVRCVSSIEAKTLILLNRSGRIESPPCRSRRTRLPALGLPRGPCPAPAPGSDRPGRTQKGGLLEALEKARLASPLISIQTVHDRPLSVRLHRRHRGHGFARVPAHRVALGGLLGSIGEGPDLSAYPRGVRHVLGLQDGPPGVDCIGSTLACSVERASGRRSRDKYFFLRNGSRL
jgi:hypothetical protein